jgi:patatin-like phospholipase/acyl hydrolase
MKKILSIDGGGIRGLIPALVLAEIEKRTGRAVAECFDLIAGTSTGGILALGFARDDGNGKPRYAAKDLAGIYQTRGREIFSRSLWKGATSLGSRYVRMQTSLAVASDDMDNATNGNVENLKAEAGTLIQTHKAEMGMVCGVLQEAT